MRFLATLLVAIIVFTYYVSVGIIIHFLPIWLGVIAQIFALALAIYLLTEASSK